MRNDDNTTTTNFGGLAVTTSDSLYPWAHELEVLRGLDVEALKPIDRAMLAACTAALRDSMLREAGARVLARLDTTEAERLAVGFADIHDAAVVSNERTDLVGF
jgi:hypothetical protein